MVCPKCGAFNNDNSWRCRHCYAMLKEDQAVMGHDKPGMQIPLRQPRPANLQAVHSSVPENPSSREKGAPAQTSRLSSSTASASPSSAPEPQPEKQPPSTATGGASITTGTRTGLWMGVVAVFLLLIGGVAAFLWLTPDDHQASALFAQAEEFYKEGNYHAALVAYRQFLEKFPDNALAIHARRKMEDIQEKLRQSEEAAIHRQEQVGILLEKARRAYRKQRFLFPRYDNVIKYTNEVLLLDPANGEALDLQARVVAYYEKQAERAAKRRQWRKAEEYYQNILEIVPNDTRYQEKLEEVRARRRRRS
ncbi:MAG: hypothetical protein D6681_05300 [Calditrichaeota bacterium]|nr:MAG: hypothetical protein D6681_05300 [Calditrichota bacterium]